MITRIEIDGFKTFEGFSLDLQPFTAIVGPNGSGKSNLFDALRFLSLLAQQDIPTATRSLRGDPEELFRRNSGVVSKRMSFAVEVLLSPIGVDDFGTTYKISGQRVRYEVKLALVEDDKGTPTGIFVKEETCCPIPKNAEKAKFSEEVKIDYGGRRSAFIEMNENGEAIMVRQDGDQKRGLPRRFSLKVASRTTLSTMTTAEFPHLNALRDVLMNIRFLEINPAAARAENDRFEDRLMKADASNLAAVLAHQRQDTGSELRPDGVLADIAADLCSLIPSVRRLVIQDDPGQKRYSFSLEFHDGSVFSSRVISDGTIRLLVLLTVLNDPRRRGTLCFEEPENGVHEGRIGMLVEILRNSAYISMDTREPSFQILLNTHSPRVMESLQDSEIVAADNVFVVEASRGRKAIKTRMRTGVKRIGDLVDPAQNLTKFEIERLLHQRHDAA